MFNVSAWAIRRPLPALMIFFVLCVAGIHGFIKLPIARFPDIAFPMVATTINLPGAAPSQLEAEVTRKIEDAVATINGVKRVMSNVNEGVSTTTIEFQLEVDVQVALDDVRDAVSRIRMDLPVDIEEPIVAKIEVVGGTLLTYAVESERMQPDELSWFVDRTVSKAMYGIKGIATVKRIGGIEREVRVDLDPQALNAFGITAGQVSSQLARIQVERPGGQMEWAGERQVVRTVGTVADADALRAYSISLADGRSVRLDSIATLRDAAADTSQIALLNGQSVIGFDLSRSRGSSEVAVAQQVRATLKQLEAAHPGVKFVLVNSTVEEAERSYSSSMTMLLEGSLLALAVVFLFLRDWRATWVSAVALPLSIVPTFAVMHWFGFSLNLITLLALSVVVGILVDDAIVEVENIVRHLRHGQEADRCRTRGRRRDRHRRDRDLADAGGRVRAGRLHARHPGKFFREFGWTAATAVLFSLLVARLLTPMMAAYQMRAKPVQEHDGKVMVWYLGWVDAALRHRWLTLIVAALLFVASLAIVPLIPATFIPTSDLGRSNLSIELPPGTRIEETYAVAEEVRAKLKPIGELKQVYSSIGAVLDIGDPTKTGIGETRKATLILDWGEARHRERSQKQLENEVRRLLADVAGARISFLSTEPGELMQLVLSGDDGKTLGEAAAALERDLRTLPGLGSITSTAALLRPEIVIEPDPARAADLGVATADIAEAARIATAGDFSQRLAKLNLPDRQIPIRVGVAKSALATASLIGHLRVPGKHGPVPLSAVADIRLDSGPAQIDRATSASATSR
jgi:multidrug efflux pump subunit AcrB